MRFVAYPDCDGWICTWYWNSRNGQHAEEQQPQIAVRRGEPVQIEVLDPADENLRMAAAVVTQPDRYDVRIMNFARELAK